MGSRGRPSRHPQGLFIHSHKNTHIRTPPNTHTLVTTRPVALYPKTWSLAPPPGPRLLGAPAHSHTRFIKSGFRCNRETLISCKLQTFFCTRASLSLSRLPQNSSYWVLNS